MREGYLYRVTLTEWHYDLVRRYMVENKLPNARTATHRMIEVAAKRSGGNLLSEVVDKDDEDDQSQKGRNEKRQVHSRA